MNVTLYATTAARNLGPGDVILDVADPLASSDAGLAVLPGRHRVDEIRDRLDGRTIFTRPLSRNAGKRRTWIVDPDDEVAIEVDPVRVVGVLRDVRKVAAELRLSAVLGPDTDVAKTIEVTDDE